uniref:Odorant binding protein C03 n=1 Tax=Anthonomus eugenii TaxID=122869 RepID=A0AA95Z9E3_9CUCU|nr:odorant binding protein C03 [Anthonomus eugenii]
MNLPSRTSSKITKKPTPLLTSMNMSNVCANFHEHVKCVSKGLNLIQEDGKINPEGVKTHIGHIVSDQAKADSIFKECAQDKGSERENTKHLWECLYEKHVFGSSHGHHHSSESSSSSEEHHHH